MKLLHEVDPLDFDRINDDGDSSKEIHQNNHWLSTSSLIVGAMAGAGVLGIAEAVQQTGWLGVPLLVIVAAFNTFTGIILGTTMREMPTNLLGDYAAIGTYAFGNVGRWVSHLSQYVTLSGVSVIFLVLTGILMNIVVHQAPRGFFTLVIGILLIPFLIIFRSLSEAKWASYFAVLATLFACILSVVVALIFYYSDDYEDMKEDDPDKWRTRGFVEDSSFATGFSVFTFAFGATALFPNLYAHMSKPNDWPKAVISSYAFSLLTMFIPVAVIVYLVLGDALAGTNNVFDALPKYIHFADVPVRIAAAVIVFHLLMALPIIITPVLQKAEDIVNKRKVFLITIVTRATIVTGFTIIGLFLPYFLPLMGVVTNVSVTVTSYLLPPLFYVKVVRPTPVIMLIMCIITFLFGLVGSGVGLYEAMKQLIDAVKQNPNPFSGLFEFNT